MGQVTEQARDAEVLAPPFNLRVASGYHPVLPHVRQLTARHRQHRPIHPAGLAKPLGQLRQQHAGVAVRRIL
jgi:hypothetical protein